jgi:hypothetical protein
MGYEIGQFTTDKVSHGYMEAYTPVFNSIVHCERVLEIGIWDGDSLKMFNTIFPDAMVYGMDIVDSKQYRTDKISTHVGDQESRIDLERVYRESGGKLFDLILDDGGHTMKQQQTTFGYMFQYVKPGGYFIIEDLHTSMWRGQWFNNDCLVTTLDMLIHFNNNSKIVSNYITDEEARYLEEQVEFVSVWSRTEHMNESVTSIIKKKF